MHGVYIHIYILYVYIYILLYMYMYIYYMYMYTYIFTNLVGISSNKCRLTFNKCGINGMPLILSSGNLT